MAERRSRNKVRNEENWGRARIQRVVPQTMLHLIHSERKVKTIPSGFTPVLFHQKRGTGWAVWENGGATPVDSKRPVGKHMCYLKHGGPIKT